MIVRFTNEDDHATFKSATMTMRGQPLQQRTFKTYNPQITFVNLYGLMEADAKTAAMLVNKAMSKYGRILDIVLYKKGTFLSDAAQVVIEMAEDQTVEGIIHTDEYIVHAVGKRVNKGCTYCKKEGHVRADCPARPQTKRERQQLAAQSNQQSSPDSPQNEAWAKRKKGNNTQVEPTRVKPVVQTTKVDKAGDTRVTYESMQVDDAESDDSSAPSLADSLL
ncbi:hypothetical protein GGI05_001806 [Coemansia sp. RSA 2603]|nr:hypothetical protein GGI05_001806 [Coemansia sp. RSA 2603]